MIFKTPVSSFSLSRGIQQTKDTTAQSVENFLKQQLKTQETMSRLNISQTLLAIHVTNVILYSQQSVSSQYRSQESMENKTFNKLLYSSGQTFQDPSELSQFVRKDLEQNKHYCTLCERFSHRSAAMARNHVESQHFPNIFSYPCDLCGDVLTSKSSFMLHRSGI